jgi:rhodanese-related sulfurtransferase
MKTKFILSMIAAFASVFFVHGQQIKQVNSSDVARMLKADKSLVVLDVRTADEFKAGHINGAINIDVRQPDAFSKIDKLNHNAKYVVHCRTNHRSKITVDHMAESGFKTIYQMTDGYSGWIQNNLPVVK